MQSVINGWVNNMGKEWELEDYFYDFQGKLWLAILHNKTLKETQQVTAKNREDLHKLILGYLE